MHNFSSHHFNSHHFSSLHFSSHRFSSHHFSSIEAIVFEHHNTSTTVCQPSEVFSRTLLMNNVRQHTLLDYRTHFNIPRGGVGGRCLRPFPIHAWSSSCSLVQILPIASVGDHIVISVPHKPGTLLMNQNSIPLPPWNPWLRIVVSNR